MFEHIQGRPLLVLSAVYPNSNIPALFPVCDGRMLGEYFIGFDW